MTDVIMAAPRMREVAAENGRATKVSEGPISGRDVEKTRRPLESLLHSCQATAVDGEVQRARAMCSDSVWQREGRLRERTRSRDKFHHVPPIRPGRGVIRPRGAATRRNYEGARGKRSPISLDSYIQLASRMRPAFVRFISHFPAIWSRTTASQPDIIIQISSLISYHEPHSWHNIPEGSAGSAERARQDTLMQPDVASQRLATCLIFHDVVDVWAGPRQAMCDCWVDLDGQDDKSDLLHLHQEGSAGSGDYLEDHLVDHTVA